MTTKPITPKDLVRLDLDRLRAYRDNLDFYNGVQWPGRARGRERRLTFNYARAFVDKVTSYLMSGGAIVVEPSDESAEAGERARRAEAALRRIYEDNDLEQLDFDTELDAAIIGDGCYKVIWDADAPDGGRVRVTAPDVQGVYAWWHGDDVGRVWRVASRYRLAAAEAAALYGVQSTSRSRDGARPASIVEVWTDDSLELWVDDSLVEERANPYGFIPFVVFPNIRQPKQFWGVSDVPQVVEPSRELNRALSQLSMILELSGNPIAVLENVESAQDIAVAPGAVWELPERARAYLLDLLQGGGVKLHTDYVDLLYRTLHDLSEAPRTSFGDNSRALSGVALEMELHPLLQKVMRKRLVRSAVYRRRARLMLQLLEQHSGERFLPCRCRVVWGSLLPQDIERRVTAERALVEAGIHSRRRAMAELGVPDPEAEFGRWLEERARTKEEA